MELAAPIRERYLSAMRAVNTLFVVLAAIVTMVAVFVRARADAAVSTGVQEHRRS